MVYDVAEKLTAVNFAKTGYDFAGWAKTADGIVEYDDEEEVENLTTEDGDVVELFAKWTARTDTAYKINLYFADTEGAYTLAADVEEREGTSDSKITFVTTDASITINGTKYEATGFSYDADETGISDTTEMTIAADGKLEIDVYFSRNQYTLTIRENGGTYAGASTAIKQYYETTYDVAEINREGHAFKEWTLTGSGTYVDGVYTFADGDATLAAEWTILSYTLTVSGDKGVKSVTATGTGVSGGTDGEYEVVYGSTVTLTYELQPGFNFKAYESEETVISDNIFSMPAEAVSVEVTTNENPYTIILNLNGGVGSTQKVEISALYDTPVALTTIETLGWTKSGYVFGGWGLAPEDTTADYTDGESVSRLATTGIFNLYAIWGADKYDITFNGNGATSGDMEAMEDVSFASEVTLTTNTFTRTGYTFIGWSEDKSATAATYKDGETFTYSNAYNTELFAIWSENSYTLKLDANDAKYQGTAELIEGKVSTQTLKYETETANLATIYTREGYVFASWNTMADGSGTSYAAAETPNKLKDGSTGNTEITLYAIWTPVVVDYKVVHYGQTIAAAISGTTTFTVDNRNNYEILDTEEEKANTDSTAIYAFTTFEGFTATTSMHTNASNSLIVLADGTLEIYLLYTRDSATVSVELEQGVASVDVASTSRANNFSFTANGTATIFYGEALTITAVTKVGYEDAAVIALTGATSTSDTATTFAMPDGNVEVNVSAIAQEVAYTVYHYTENLSGGFDIHETENLTGKTDTTAEAEVQTITNYHQDSAVTGTILEANINGDGSTKLYVYYKLDTYTLTLEADEHIGTVSAAGEGLSYADGVYTIKVTAKITLTYTGVASGYSFKGWTVEDEVVTVAAEGTFTMPASNLTITGTTEPITYTIHYHGNTGLVNGEEIATEEIKFAASTTIFAANTASKTGYTFAGWNTSSAGGEATAVAAGSAYTHTTAADYHLYAQWTANEYDVIYMANNGTEENYTDENGATYDSEYTFLGNVAAFEKTGYTFLGWADSESATAAQYTEGSKITKYITDGATTVYAVWKANTYTIIYNSNQGDKYGTMGGTTTSTKETYDASVTIAANGYTFDGYNFTGWAETETGAVAYTAGQVVEKANFSSEVNGTKTLYAVWEALKYTISIYGKDANVETDTAVEIIEMTYGADYTDDTLISNIADKYTETGYNLTGFFTTANGGSMLFDAAGKIQNSVTSDTKIMDNGTWALAENLNIFANYSAKPYTVTFDITSTKPYDASNVTISGGNTNITKTVRYAETFGEDGVWPTPTLSGYHFDKWSTGGVNGEHYRAIALTQYAEIFSADASSIEAAYIFSRGEGDAATQYVYVVTDADNKPTATLETVANVEATFVEADDEVWDIGDAGLTVYATWIGRTDIEYTLYYYKEAIAYDKSAEEFDTTQGDVYPQVADTINYKNKTYVKYAEGVYNDALVADKVENYLKKEEFVGFDYYAYEYVGDIIENEGHTKIYSFYTRQEYTLTLGLEKGVKSVFATGTGVSGGTNNIYSVKYEAAVTISAETMPGYKFNIWNSVAGYTAGTNFTKVDDNGTYTFTMPSTTVGVYYTATATAQSVTYKVEHYRENIEDAGYTIFGTAVEHTGTTDTTASIDAVRRNDVGFSTIAYYTVTTSTLTDEKNGSLNIEGDEKLTIKIYYTRNKHSLTVTASDKGVKLVNAEGSSFTKSADALSVTYTVKFGDTITLVAEAKVGYTLTDWSEDANSTAVEISANAFTMVDGNVMLTANADANEDTQYQVNYYVQKANGQFVLDTEFTEYTITGVTTEAFETGITDTNAPIAALSEVAYPGMTLSYYITKSTSNGKTDGAFNEVKNGLLNIDGDGSLVIDMYYTRDTFDLTLATSKGISAVSAIITDGITAGETANTYKVMYNVKVQLTHQTTTAGYTFKEWTGDVTVAADQTFTMPENAVALTATATPNEYTITFNANGGATADGKTILSQKATYDTEITLDANTFVKEGYDFLGWSSAAESTTVVRDDSATFKYETIGGTTLFAVWGKNDYSILYDANGGTGSMAATKAVYDESKLMATVAFVRDGYTFEGWSTDKNATEFENVANAQTEGIYFDGTNYYALNLIDKGEITVFAIWSENSYTLTLDANDANYQGTATMTGTTNVQTLKYETEKADLSEIYTREGYTFKEWNTLANGSGTSYAATETPNKLKDGSTGNTEITLYAIWTAVEVKYTVNVYEQIIDAASDDYNTTNYDLVSTDNTLKAATDSTITVASHAAARDGFTYVDTASEDQDRSCCSKDPGREGHRDHQEDTLHRTYRRRKDLRIRCGKGCQGSYR